MQSQTWFLVALALIPLPAAVAASRRCRSPVARALLGYGAIGFAILLTGATTFLLSCEGNLIYGLGPCGTRGYFPPNIIQAMIGLIYAAYAVIGPILVIIASVAEARIRRRPRDGNDTASDRR